MIQYVFTLFAISQGSLVLGLTIFIFLYYVPKNRKQATDNMRLHVVFAAASYVGLIISTVETAIMEHYTWGAFWYWMVTISYIVGDISLIFIFKACVKRDAREKNKNKTE